MNLYNAGVGVSLDGFAIGSLSEVVCPSNTYLLPTSAVPTHFSNA